MQSFSRFNASLLMFSNFSRFKSILLSIVSNAEDKARRITCVGVLVSMLCMRVSVT